MEEKQRQKEKKTNLVWDRVGGLFMSAKLNQKLNWIQRVEVDMGEVG
jgi:hypothetical protein